jgi:hypothetical protein
LNQLSKVFDGKRIETEMKVLAVFMLADGVYRKIDTYAFTYSNITAYIHGM